MSYEEILKSTFDGVINTPLEAWKEYVSYCELVTVKKNEVIKPENKTERFFNFIVKGSAGIFLWKENNFVCLDFAFDREFCTDYMSIITKGPTPLQVMTLEDSEILKMKVSDYNMITQKSIGKMIRLIASESTFVEKQQQQIELMTLSAKHRYQNLLNRFPNIQNRIAQNHIASYLGITPQSLSRLRKD